MTAWYRAGTVEAINGSTTVTGTLTAFLANAKTGDLWAPDTDGRGYEIVAVNDNNEIEIFPAYAGSSGSDKDYGIARISPNWNSVSELSVSLADVLAAQSAILAGIDVPSDEIGADGDIYFRQDSVAEYYRKESGAWVLVTSLIGPPGPGGPSFQATSTSSLAIGTGAKTFTVEANRGYTAGQWLRATHDTSNYVEGPVISYSGTTLVLNILAGRAIGSGTYASWNINITGEPGPATAIAIGSVTTGTPGTNASAEITGTSPSLTLNLTIPRGNTGATGPTGPQGMQGNTGATGPIGPGYAGTSTTSLTISTGPKSLTTQASLGYGVGTRCRLSSNANPQNFMEGVVTSYTSGTGAMSILIDIIGGSGTRTDWNLSLAGQPGLGTGTVSNATDGIELISGGATARLADTAVTPGAYGAAGSIPVITVDQKGRIMAASSIAIADPVAMAIIFGG